VPTLLVLNKIDRLPPEAAESIARERRGIPVSAIDPATFDPLIERLERTLFAVREGLAVAGTDREYGDPPSGPREITSVDLIAHSRQRDHDGYGRSRSEELDVPIFDDAAIDEVIGRVAPPPARVRAAR
jgi:GTPase